MLKIISQTTFFQGLRQDQLEKINAIAGLRQYLKGECIFFEGDVADGFYIVVTGRVKISKVSLEGREQILHIFGPGEPFGEAAVFCEQPFPANAEALIATQLLFLPRIEFVNLIRRHPSMALNMLAVLSQRLKAFTLQIENLSLKEVPGRLSSYLLLALKEQWSDQDDQTVITLPISKGQLASLLGTTPETLSRILTKMSAEKLIKVQGSKIELLDQPKIQILAEE